MVIAGSVNKPSGEKINALSVRLDGAHIELKDQLRIIHFLLA